MDMPLYVFRDFIMFFIFLLPFFANLYFSFILVTMLFSSTFPLYFFPLISSLLKIFFLKISSLQSLNMKLKFSPKYNQIL